MTQGRIAAVARKAVEHAWRTVDPPTAHPTVKKVFRWEIATVIGQACSECRGGVVHADSSVDFIHATGFLAVCSDCEQPYSIVVMETVEDIARQARVEVGA